MHLGCLELHELFDLIVEMQCARIFNTDPGDHAKSPNPWVHTNSPLGTAQWN